MISLILGLGNIGAEYDGTRHNVGFDVLDRVATLQKATPQRSTRDYAWALIERSPEPLVLAWPRTYMNRSGRAAVGLLERLEADPRQMLVVVDDFNLPLGALRFRRNGSDGGHNGLASIIEELGTEDFPRLRLGIGPAPDNTSTVDFVLGKFDKEELQKASDLTNTAAEAVIFASNHRLDEAMSEYNRNPAQL